MQLSPSPLVTVPDILHTLPRPTACRYIIIIISNSLRHFVQSVSPAAQQHAGTHAVVTITVSNSLRHFVQPVKTQRTQLLSSPFVLVPDSLRNLPRPNACSGHHYHNLNLLLENFCAFQRSACSCPPACLPFCLSVSMSVCLCLCLSVCLSVCWSVYLTISQQLGYRHCRLNT